MSVDLDIIDDPPEVSGNLFMFSDSRVYYLLVVFVGNDECSVSENHTENPRFFRNGGSKIDKMNLVVASFEEIFLVEDDGSAGSEGISRISVEPEENPDIQ